MRKGIRKSTELPELNFLTGQTNHRERRIVRQESPDIPCRGLVGGGGGGTVIPHLSMRPGLCLHPVSLKNWMRGVLFADKVDPANPSTHPAYAR